MDVVTAAKLWLTVKPIKRIREARQKRKEQTSEGIEYEVSEDSAMLKGKLTYTGIAVLAVSWGLERFGIPATPEEIEAIVTAGAAVVGAAIALYGRWRASRGAE